MAEDNRRKYTRTEFIGGGWVLNEAKELIKVDILDLSVQGMKISFTDKLVLGDNIHIMPMVFEADKENFEFVAEVVRIKEFDGFIGIKILSGTIECFMRLVSTVIKHEGCSDSIRQEIRHNGQCFAMRKEDRVILDMLNMEKIKETNI
jgi:hypothetical protein